MSGVCRVRHGHGFYQAIPLYGIGLAFSLHLAWYHGPVESRVTSFRYGTRESKWKMIT
jgi:hypothetical protein